MKTFHIPVKITLDCSFTIEAEDIESASKKADDAMYWAYQSGAPEEHENISINDCEIEVDGEVLDLLEAREEPEE